MPAGRSTGFIGFSGIITGFIGVMEWTDREPDVIIATTAHDVRLAALLHFMKINPAPGPHLAFDYAGDEDLAAFVAAYPPPQNLTDVAALKEWYAALREGTQQPILTIFTSQPDAREGLYAWDEVREIRYRKPSATTATTMRTPDAVHVPADVAGRLSTTATLRCSENCGSALVITLDDFHSGGVRPCPTQDCSGGFDIGHARDHADALTLTNQGCRWTEELRSEGINLDGIGD